MSTLIQHNLFVGSLHDLETANGLDVISLCPATHHGRHLHINMVDASSPKYFHLEQFSKAIHWVDPMQPTLIHCALGRSRAPSVAMTYLAYHGLISSDSYYGAYKDFKLLYPAFAPNTGIREFMAEWWKGLMER